MKHDTFRAVTWKCYNVNEIDTKKVGEEQQMLYVETK